MQIMQLAGNAMNVVGDIVSGNQASSMADRNAGLLDEQAAETRRVAYERAGITRQRNAGTLSARRTAMLQNGVDPGTGSALIDSEQQYRDAELDALTLRYQGLMQARSIGIEADQTRWEGRAKKRQYQFKAVGDLIGGASKYLSGTQAPAPVETRTPKPNPYYKGS